MCSKLLYTIYIYNVTTIVIAVSSDKSEFRAQIDFKILPLNKKSSDHILYNSVQDVLYKPI